MADHYYSQATEGVSPRWDAASIAVNTSAQAGNPIELRVTDAAMTRQECYEFCEKMADFFASNNSQVIVAGTLKVP